MALLALHGAIVFRGCDISGDQRFDRFVTAFGLENFPYDESLSNAVRRNRTPRIFTANEAPCDVEIFLHHEMAQTPLFPRYLFFCCEQAAEVGGATPLCRSDVLLQRLQVSMPHFIDQCREKGAATLSSCRAFQIKPRGKVEVGETRWVLNRGRLPRRDWRHSIISGSGCLRSVSRLPRRHCP